MTSLLSNQTTGTTAASSTTVGTDTQVATAAAAIHLHPLAALFEQSTVNKGGVGETGGIAWAGSLLGSKNPNNLGYRYSTPAKRYRKSGDDAAADDYDKNPLNDLPSNLQVQFCNRQGEELGQLFDLPLDSSVDDLTALIHTLLADESAASKVPYSFHAILQKKDSATGVVVDEVEVTTSLKDFLIQQIVQHHQQIQQQQQSTKDDKNKDKTILPPPPAFSTESVLKLVYQPLSVFRVRPVTRCTDTLPGHTEAVLHVSYSPDGTLLASGGGDATVRFWDVWTNLPRFTCHNVHKNHVLCTAWSPDGQRFASGDKNGVLIVWDPKTGKPLCQKHIKAHSQWITALAWEPMHTAKIASNNNNNNDKSSDENTASNNNNLAICDRLATSSKDATIKLWNARTQTAISTLSGHTDSVEAIQWGGAGLLYSASRDRTIKVWCPNRGILVRTLTGHGHRINTLALSTEYVLRTGPFDHKRKKFATPQEAHAAAVEKYESFCQQQGGPERLVSGSDDFTLFVWNPTVSKHPLKRLTGHQQAVNHIAFSPDGRYFASASFDKKVKLWNGFSGDFLQTLTGHVGAVYQVAWSGDSRFLVSASKDSTAKLWEIQSNSSGGGAKRAKETLPGHADEVYALDWSPHGGSVATGSKDRTIKIWKH